MLKSISYGSEIGKGRSFFSRDIAVISLGVIFMISVLVIDIFVNETLFMSLLALPVILLLLLDFDLVLKVLIALSFTSVLGLWYQHIAVNFMFVVVMSFIITQKDLHLKDFATPFTIPIAIYLITCLVSLYNSVEIHISILKSISFFAFAALIFILPVYLDSYRKINSLINVYLLLSVINAVIVIYVSLASHIRAFGIAGVMYVDLVNIAFIISMNYLIMEFKSRWVSFLLCGLFLIASFMMQTRNAWIVLFSTILIVFIYIIKNYSHIGIQRRSMVKGIALLFALIIGMYVLTITLNSAVVERISSMESKSVTLTEGGYASNTLVTRLLIWHTAYLAFKAHPIIGIGWYAFPFSSHIYTKVPALLYDKYVRNVTPHLGYIAVLTETGIIGLIAFIILLFSIIKVNIKAIKACHGTQSKFLATTVFYVMLYIAVSLAFTDAWLWGSGAIIWGVFIAIGLANMKILKLIK